MVLLLAACAPEAIELQPGVTVAADASNPTIETTPDGASYIAWVGKDDGLPAVWLARSGDDGYGEPVRVNDRPGDAAPHEQAPAQVATGRNSEVYVVWQNATPVPGRRFPASDLRFARSIDGGRTFEPAITINDDSASGIPSSHTFHDIAVAPDGTIIVSWIDSRARDQFRALHPELDDEGMSHHGSGSNDAAKEPAEATSPTRPIAPAPHRPGAPAPDGPTSEVRFAVSTDGGRTFSANRVVATDVCPCCRTALAVGPGGEVYIAWRKIFEGDVRDVVVARKEAGESDFGELVRVYADDWVFPGCPHAGPALTVDRNGDLYVAWYTGREGRQGLWWARSEDGGRNFSEPGALVTGGFVPPSQVKLAATAEGVWAAVDRRTTDAKNVELIRLAGSGPRITVRHALAGASPALAVVDQYLFLAWLDGEHVRTSRVMLHD